MQKGMGLTAVLAGSFLVPAIARSQIVVDGNSGLVAATGGNTPIPSFTVNSADDLLVLEVVTRTNLPGLSSTPTYGGTPLTLATSKVSAIGTMRATYLYYLPTPTAGTAGFNIAYNDSTSSANDYAYAFNLKNVDLTNLPTPSNQTGSIDTAGSPNTASVTIASAPVGSMAVGLYAFGLNGGTNSGTLTASSSDSTPGVTQFSSLNQNGSSTDTEAVYFSPLVGGSTTFNFGDTGAAGTKDVLDVAVFSALASSPVPEPASLGILGVATVGLLARRRTGR